MQASTSTSGKRQLPEIRARSFDRDRDPRSLIENLLTEKQQKEFEKIATVLEYRRGGSTVFAEGEDAHFVYSIAAGVVRVSRLSQNGRRQVLALMLPGDLFGLPDAGVYVNSAETACPATLYRVPWLQLRSLMIREPVLQLNLFNRVAYDLREAQRRIMTLGQQNVCQRLASLLLDFAMHPAFFDAERAVLELPLSRFDIADYLGTASETVTRGLGRLEQDGVIRRLNSRVIEIRNLSALQAMQTEKRRKDL
jgi:CRP-like cAMP-binding protein